MNQRQTPLVSIGFILVFVAVQHGDVAPANQRVFPRRAFEVLENTLLYGGPNKLQVTVRIPRAGDITINKEMERGGSVKAIAYTLPEVYTKQINSILKQTDLRKTDPGGVLSAADLAGGLRLKGCAEHLVPWIDLERNLHFTIIDSRRRKPVVWALIEIGKASVPYVLKLLEKKNATNEELSGAALVIHAIEGNLAPIVIDGFLQQSKVRNTVSKNIERPAFKAGYKGAKLFVELTGIRRQ